MTKEQIGFLMQSGFSLDEIMKMQAPAQPEPQPDPQPVENPVENGEKPTAAGIVFHNSQLFLWKTRKTRRAKQKNDPKQSKRKK